MNRKGAVLAPSDCGDSPLAWAACGRTATGAVAGSAEIAGA